MLFTLSEILKQAQKKQYAVVAPDFFSLDFAQILLDCASEHHAPLILSYCHSEFNTFELDDIDQCIHIARELSDKQNVPVALHLDHALDINIVHKYLDLGFTSVMIDASMRSFDENVKITQKVVSLARTYHASVEAELGHVGNGSDYLVSDPSAEELTNPMQVKEFVNRTEVDALAVSIGTQHGFYRVADCLHLDLLEEIAHISNIPLVLHGTSGTDHDQIRQAVQRGICKLNVFTELFTAYQQASLPMPVNNLKDVNERNLTRRQAVFKKLNTYFELSSSLGKAKDLLNIA
ncbi:MAG: class II fructose-bisphosphate aldolase [Chloroflexi bacterium]|nr:class II fructose-bisphosphate aldolase [Chloroflexota bacterium]